MNEQLELLLWDDIIADLRDEGCILFLGTDFLRQNDKPIWSALLKDCATVYQKQIALFDEKNELFIFKTDILKNSMVKRILQKYSEINDFDIFEKLVQIPFHCVVSLSPDDLLQRVVKAKVGENNFNLFSKTRPIVEDMLPDKRNPLFYNLAGILTLEESVVLSHNDLFDYLFAILGDNKLPKYLTQTVANAKRLIFLGFKFEKWYMQLILRLFNLHKEKRFNHALNKNIEPDTEKLCSASFQEIEFIDDSGYEFVNILFQKCNEQNFLREVKSTVVAGGEELTSEMKKKKMEMLLNQTKMSFDYLEKLETQKLVALTLKEEENMNLEIEKTKKAIERFEQELKKMA